jgi:hypothetical protein
VDPVHLRLAQLGLRVAADYGFALAGGYAVQAHGLLERPSEDIDLFTAWERRADFGAAVDAVVDAYRDAGYSVEMTQRFDTFARLAVSDPAKDRRLAAYNADPARIAALRDRFAQWRDELLGGQG